MGTSYHELTPEEVKLRDCITLKSADGDRNRRKRRTQVTCSESAGGGENYVPLLRNAGVGRAEVTAGQSKESWGR